MTTSRSLDRSLHTEREDLESLFSDVVVAVLGEEVEAITTGTAPDADVDGGAGALLAIHDERDDTYLGVHVRVSGELARLLAARMMACEDPSREDLLDAVGELGNIAGGNVKSLLFTSARLSLPSAARDDTGLPPAREGAPEPTVIRALVLGQVAELALVPHVDGDGLLWPPSVESDESSEVLQEAQS
jgi:chemotaxis protein CheX